MITVKVYSQAIKQTLNVAMKGVAKDKILPAVEAGAVVIERAYKDILDSVKTKPGGPNFVNAVESIGHKTVLFDNGLGAYFVVGSRREGGQRVAPQVLWGEEGTAERYTSRHEYRGIMPRQYWLQLAYTSSIETARMAMLAKLKSNVR